MNLIYYPARGSCDAIRMILAWAKNPYIETNLTGAEFSQVKTKFKYRVLPVLEDNGLSIQYEGAILRYLARKFELYGETETEKAKIDEWIEVWQDLLTKLWAVEGNTVELSHQDHKKRSLVYYLDHINPVLIDMESVLAQNETHFLVGTKLTIADILIRSGIDSIAHELGNTMEILKLVFEDHLLLGLVYAWVSEVPQIKTFCSDPKRR